MNPIQMKSNKLNNKIILLIFSVFLCGFVNAQINITSNNNWEFDEENSIIVELTNIDVINISIDLLEINYEEYELYRTPNNNYKKNFKILKQNITNFTVYVVVTEGLLKFNETKIFNITTKNLYKHYVDKTKDILFEILIFMNKNYLKILAIFCILAIIYFMVVIGKLLK